MKLCKRASDRCTRNELHSPGHPPGWQRENVCRFWQAIACGRTSEDAAMAAGVSAPVGVRWFRGAGGMPPTHLSPSAKPTIGRYLTFSEREDIAVEVAKGTGINAIARKLGRSPSTISRELTRNAATRGGRFDYRAKHRAIACRPGCTTAKGKQAGDERRIARLCTRSARGSSPCTSKAVGHYAGN